MKKGSWKWMNRWNCRLHKKSDLKNKVSPEVRLFGVRKPLKNGTFKNTV